MVNVKLAAECLVAVSGLYPSRPLRAGDARKAERLAGDWQKAVAGFFAASKPGRARATPEARYLATWKRLNTRQDDSRLIRKLTDPQIAMAYVVQLRRARDYLRAQWHPLTVKGLATRQLLEPGLSEQQRASDLYAMVNDPDRLVNALSSGSLLPEEMAAVRNVYPELWSMLAVLIRSEIVKQLGRRKRWEPLWWQEQSVRTLLGMAQDQEIKPVMAQDGQPPGPPQVKIGVKGGGDKGDGLTRADRVDSGQPAP